LSGFVFCYGLHWLRIVAAQGVSDDLDGQLRTMV